MIGVRHYPRYAQPHFVAFKIALASLHMVCGVSRSSSLGSTPVRSKMTTRTWIGKDWEVQCEAKAHGAAMRRAILRRNMQTWASRVGSTVARLGELKLEGGFWCIALSWKRVITYKVVHGWLKLAAKDTEITFALVLQNQVCATTQLVPVRRRPQVDLEQSVRGETSKRTSGEINTGICMSAVHPPPTMEPGCTAAKEEQAHGDAFEVNDAQSSKGQVERPEWFLLRALAQRERNHDQVRAEFGRTYKMGVVLGEGTFSIVHAATRTTDQLQCAIKGWKDPKGSAVVHEIALLEKLKHTNIVPLLDVWCVKHEFYMVLGYLPRTLRCVLKQQPRPIVSVMSECMRQLTMGLEHTFIRRGLCIMI